jgi:hypothetical protein
VETVVYVTIPVAVRYTDPGIDPIYMALRAIGEALPHSIERRQYKTEELLATMHVGIPYVPNDL